MSDFELETHVLGRKVLEHKYDTGELGSTSPQVCQAAIAGFRDALVPLLAIEPNLDGRGAANVRASLTLFGALIAPNMSDERAKAWRQAAVISLSDLPAQLVCKAASVIIHQSFEFLNQVVAAIRAEAKFQEERHKRGLFRLERLRDKLLNPAPSDFALPAPNPNRPIPADEIRNMGAELRKLGLTGKFFTSAEVDAALDNDVSSVA